MDILSKLNKDEIREFFSKGWITHDAMWFYHSILELGPERANKINKAAVASMASIEIQRILKLMGRGREPITTFDELKEVVNTCYGLILPKFMKMFYGFPEKNLLRGGFHECFAYEGVKRAGIADTYECGVIVRVKSWIDSLGVKYELIPDFSGCLMRDHGKCEMDFRFNLD